MNIKQLTYFIAVAEELHFGRAAERLNIAQPPLSRQIKQMEETLGAQLFNRGRNAITMTQAGERLFERGSALLSELDDIKLEMKRFGQGAEGRLRIGFVGSSTFGILPSIIKSFRENYKETNLNLHPMNNAQLHRALVSRQIDIAFARPALNDSEFVTRKLSSEPLIIAVPDHLYPVDKIVNIADLHDQNFILYPEYPRPSFADFVIEAVQAKNVEIKNRLFTMDLQTALSLVAIGEGVCIVPDSVSSAQRNGVRFHKMAQDLGQTELSISYRIDDQSIHVRHLVNTAHSVARKEV